MDKWDIHIRVKRRNVLNNDYNKEQNDKNDDNKNNGNKGKNRNVMVLLVISVILTLLCWRAYDKITNGTKKEIPYSGFVEMLDSGEVDNAEIYAKKIKFTSKESDGTLDKNTYVTVRISDDKLADRLKTAHEKYATTYKGKDESGSAMVGTILSYVVMIARILSVPLVSDKAERNDGLWQIKRQGIYGEEDRSHICRCCRRG